MLDSMFSMMLTVLGLRLYSDRAPVRVGSRHPVTYPVDAFEALDGHVVLVVSSDRAFAAFCKAIGRPGMSADERFLGNADRNAHEDELKAISEAWTGQRTSDEIVAAMDAAGIPAAPVLSVGDVASGEHIAHRDMVSTVEHPKLGAIPLVHQPVRFSGADRSFQRPPPGLGEHTRELLATLLGLGDAEIDALADEDVI